MTETPHVTRGTLLVAAPDLLDPNFMHTVSVMCDHSDTGAYGLVINKRSTLTIDRLLPDHPVLGGMSLPVAWGGPVQNDTLQIVHHFPERIPGGYEIREGVFLGGELEDVAQALADEELVGARHGIRFILGCAGWGPGQLEGEIEGGSWVPAQATRRLLFEMDRGGRDDQEETWQAALRSLGSLGRGLAVMPPDIGWN